MCDGPLLPNPESRSRVTPRLLLLVPGSIISSDFCCGGVGSAEQNPKSGELRYACGKQFSLFAFGCEPKPSSFGNCCSHVSSVPPMISSIRSSNICVVGANSCARSSDLLLFVSL